MTYQTQRNRHDQGEITVPFAFFREMIDAVIKIGLFKIAPGNAKLVHMANKPIRYSKSPRVFHVARFARGTCNGAE